MKEPKNQISVKAVFSRDEHRQLKFATFHKDVSMQEFIREAVMTAAKEVNKKNQAKLETV